MFYPTITYVSLFKNVNNYTYLNGIINEPLCSSESTDHDDPGNKALPHASETKFLGNVNGCAALLFVQFGYNCVSWMRHDGTEHTGNVTGSECHYQLLSFAAFSTGFRYYVSGKLFKITNEFNQLFIIIPQKTRRCIFNRPTLLP